MPIPHSFFFRSSNPYNGQNALHTASVKARNQEISIHNLLRTMPPFDPKKRAIRSLILECKRSLTFANIYSLHLLNQKNLLDVDETSSIGEAVFIRVVMIQPESSLTQLLSIMHKYNIITLSNFIQINNDNLLYLEILLTLKHYCTDMTAENAGKIFYDLLKNKGPSYPLNEYKQLKDLIYWTRDHLSKPIAHQMLLCITSFLNSIDSFNKENFGELLSILFTQNIAPQRLGSGSIYSLLEKLDYTQEYGYLLRAKTHPHASIIANTLLILYYNQLLFNTNGKYNFISIVTSSFPLVINEIITLLDRCNLLSATPGQKNLSALLATLNRSNFPRIKNDLSLLKHFKLLDKDAQTNLEKVLSSKMVAPTLLALATKGLLTTPGAQKHFEALLEFSKGLLEEEEIYTLWINSDMNEEEFLDLISICEHHKENPTQMELAIIDFFENLNAPSLDLTMSFSSEESITSALTASF